MIWNTGVGMKAVSCVNKNSPASQMRDSHLYLCGRGSPPCGARIWVHSILSGSGLWICPWLLCKWKLEIFHDHTAVFILFLKQHIKSVVKVLTEGISAKLAKSKLQSTYTLNGPIGNLVSPTWWRAVQSMSPHFRIAKFISGFWIYFLRLLYRTWEF